MKIIYLRYFNFIHLKKKIKLFIGAISCSIILDITWLTVYSDNIKLNKNSEDSGLFTVGRTISLILSFLIFFNKIILLISFILIK